MEPLPVAEEANHSGNPKSSNGDAKDSPQPDHICINNKRHLLGRENFSNLSGAGPKSCRWIDTRYRGSKPADQLVVKSRLGCRNQESAANGYKDCIDVKRLRQGR